MAGFGILPPTNPVSQWIDPRRSALLVLGAGFLAGNPSQAAQGAMQGMQYDQQRAEKTAEQATQAEQYNATKEWLKARGREDLIQLVDAGQGAAALQMATQTGDATKPTSGMQNYEYLISQGVGPADAMRRAFGQGETTVNVGQSEFGTIPAGFELVTDPQTGARSMRPIEGGPAWQDQQAEATQQDVKTISGVEKASAMLEDVAAAKDILRTSGVAASGTLSRPLSVLSNTPAGRLRAYLQPLTSGTALNAMMRLKEASSTGATGFGQMNQKELQLLIDDIGALNPDTTDPDILIKTLDRIETRYKRVADDIKKNVSPDRLKELGLDQLLGTSAGMGGGATSGIAPDGIDPAVWQYMTPEERALWQN
jgi:hypothetical protein